MFECTWDHCANMCICTNSFCSQLTLQDVADDTMLLELHAIESCFTSKELTESQMLPSTLWPMQHLLRARVWVRQLKFPDHILHLPAAEELCKVYTLSIPTHGKGKPGRQRTMFPRYIQQLLVDILTCWVKDNWHLWPRTVVAGGSL